MTEKELEELKKNVHTLALFLGGSSGIALAVYGMVSFGWCLIIIAVLSLAFDALFKKIIENHEKKNKK